MPLASKGPDWHAKQVAKYTALHPTYVDYANILKKTLQEMSEKYAPQCIVQARAKDISSFAEKIIRKDKYTDPVNQITDLCGARIIVHFPYQVELISQCIRDQFDVDEANSMDVRNRLRVTEFGYLSVHYIISTNKDKIMGIDIHKDIKNLKAEIQVRTVLQHAWADICHDRIYKASIRVPEHWQRHVGRIAAVLEDADEGFEDMSEALDYYTLHYGTMLSPSELEKEIELTETILDNEPNKLKKTKHAYKLGLLLRTACHWEQLVTRLSPFVHDDSIYSDNIKILLGMALNRNSDIDKKKNGIEYLKQVIDNGAEELKIKHSLINPRKLKQRSDALFLLAKYDTDSPHSDRTQWFSQAHEMDIDNPYYLAGYVISILQEMGDRHKIKLFSTTIVRAIEKCHEHIKMNIEQVRAFFTLGQLYYILGDINQSISAYTKAVDLFISDKTCIPMDKIADELNTLTLLNGGNPDLPQELGWVHWILTMAAYLKYEDPDAKQQLVDLLNHSWDKKDMDQAILIIAGGADGMSTNKIKDYVKLLTHAFRPFNGCIISGGTKSGIPGAVGDAVQKVANMGNRSISLTGYLPEILPKGVVKDDRYKQLIATKSADFSFLELLQYWTDLIMSGIDPKTVQVLGINGGEIAKLEYKLALALGARVGVIDSSGRAATDMLLDSVWGKHDHLFAVPDDAFSVWAFVNQNPVSQLTPAQIEKAAQEAHENYRRERLKDDSGNELSMLEWEKLPDDLKHSNRQQVAFMELVLNNTRFGIRQAKAPVKINFKLEAYENKVEKMAEMEHARWNIERLNKGWQYGPVKNIAKKITPYLIGWDALPEKIKMYDREAVLNYPEILANAGFEIYKLDE